MRLAALLLLAGCFSAPEVPDRPDFLTAPTRNQRITSIRFLPDAQVAERLDDLQKIGKEAAEAPVRDAVVLRLKEWADPQALPVLTAIYRDDPDHRVSRAALHALRDLCWERHGALRPNTPPQGEIPEICRPAYDGTLSLPAWRPPPRVGAAAFWSGHGVETKVLPNGEIWAADISEKNRIFAKYPRPATERRSLFDGL